MILIDWNHAIAMTINHDQHKSLAPFVLRCCYCVMTRQLTHRVLLKVQLGLALSIIKYMLKWYSLFSFLTAWSHLECGQNLDPNYCFMLGIWIRLIVTLNMQLSFQSNTNAVSVCFLRWIFITMHCFHLIVIGLDSSNCKVKWKTKKGWPTALNGGWVVAIFV